MAYTLYDKHGDRQLFRSIRLDRLSIGRTAVSYALFTSIFENTRGTGSEIGIENGIGIGI